MKRINYIFLLAISVLISLSPACSNGEVELDELGSTQNGKEETRSQIKEYTIENLTAGDLMSYMYKNNIRKPQKLTITGGLNITDLNYIKQIELESLDISGVTRLEYLGERVDYIVYKFFQGNTSLKGLVLPEYVKSINNDAFKGCTSLISIKLPESLTEIGSWAFYGCTSLVDINIPEGVTTISDRSFEYCSSLTDITFPESLTGIEKYAFAGCSSLKNINFANSLTSIGDYAFWTCKSLTELSIPESVTSIGKGAFSACSALKAVSVPESVTSIGSLCFGSCSSLKMVDWRSSMSLSNVFSESSKSNAILYLNTKDGTLPKGYDGFKIEVIDSVFDITNLDASYAPYLHGIAKELSFVKSFNEQQHSTPPWYTISLPFTPTRVSWRTSEITPFDSEIETEMNFWLRELTPDGFKDVTEIKANHAYIIAMPYGTYLTYYIWGDITFSAENVNMDELTWEPVVSEGAEYSLYPTYETVEMARDVYALNTDYWVDGYDYGSVFIHSTIGVEPFQAYAKPNDNAASMRSILPINSKRTAVRGASSPNSADSRGVVVKRKPRKEDM